ncbi:MAG: hypothetical protein H7Z75_19395 [Ferruginibacter sp.]|nr:hypothetical protein [Cytophagales bacterium]
MPISPVRGKHIPNGRWLPGSTGNRLESGRGEGNKQPGLTLNPFPHRGRNSK